MAEPGLEGRVLAPPKHMLGKSDINQLVRDVVRKALNLESEDMDKLHGVALRDKGLWEYEGLVQRRDSRHVFKFKSHKAIIVFYGKMWGSFS
jgi:hypothetical protein